MTILVTGASGFIGSFIVQEGLEQGFEVWAGMRGTSSKGYLKDERIRFATLDLANPERLKAQLLEYKAQMGGRGWDYVCHAAGATKCLREEDFFHTNTEGTRHLIDALRETGMTPRRFVFVSSLSIFGAIREQPVRKATPRLIAGSLMAVCGVAIVIFNGHFVLHLNPLGDFLALVAASSWAIYSMLMKWATQRYNSVFITRKVFFYGLVTILPVFAIHPWDYPLARMAQPVIWMNVLFLGIIASFACYALWTWAIGRIGALTTSNYVYLNPIATVVVSAIFLNVPMTAMAFIGSALILLGVYIANKNQKE